MSEGPYDYARERHEAGRDYWKDNGSHICRPGCWECGRDEADRD